jgi:hypothetical protein
MLVAVSASAQTSVPLFVIERSINKNVVHYDARLTPDGKIDPQEPVVAYWVMLAEDGRREDLNWLERTKAYGFSIQPDSRPGAYRMTLAPYPQRQVSVSQDAGGPKATVEIAGRPAILQKIYIDVVERFGLPTVRYMELFGRDLLTQKLLSEKITPR